MVWQMEMNSFGKPLRRPIQSLSAGLGAVVKVALLANDTPEGSVGKILVSSVLLDIHRCIRVIYSYAGSSIGSYRLLSQV